MKKVLLIVFLLCFLTSCSKNSIKEESSDFFAMDTYMSISARGENATNVLVDSAQAIAKLESEISRTRTQSDIYNLNNSNGKEITVGQSTYQILTVAKQIAQNTNGLFDPTICAITDLWAIGTDSAKVPTQSEIDNALKSVSYENIVLLEDNKVKLLNGAKIDLGGIGKGYAGDLVADIYSQNDILSGVIALSGNIYLYGKKEDGSPWNVGITDPDNTSEYNITLKVNEGAVVTTGAYERFFEEDGKTYHHIFNPTTGYPTNKDIKSVTVVSKSSVLADGYSTAFFAMGYKKAIEFEKTIEDIAVIIIKNDNSVYISDSIKGNVTLGEKYEN